MTVTTETATTTLKNYVGGKWVDADGADLHDVINPANGAVIARVPYSTASHLDGAVRAAREAIPVWRGVTFKRFPRNRFRISQRWKGKHLNHSYITCRIKLLSISYTPKLISRRWKMC